MKSLSCVQLLATPWTAAYQVPLSMGFSSQEYWSGVPLPSPSMLYTKAEFPNFYHFNSILILMVHTHLHPHYHWHYSHLTYEA